MLASKHSAGGFGTLDTLTPDEKRSGGPISLHNAIVPPRGGGTLETTAGLSRIIRGRSRISMRTASVDLCNVRSGTTARRHCGESPLEEFGRSVAHVAYHRRGPLRCKHCVASHVPAACTDQQHRKLPQKAEQRSTGLLSRTVSSRGRCGLEAKPR